MEYVLNITMCTYFFCQNGAADRNKSGITTGDLSAVFLVGDSINCVVKNEDIKKPKFNFNLSREKIPSEIESEHSIWNGIRTLQRREWSFDDTVPPT